MVNCVLVWSSSKQYREFDANWKYSQDVIFIQGYLKNSAFLSLYIYSIGL